MVTAHLDLAKQLKENLGSHNDKAETEKPTVRSFLQSTPIEQRIQKAV